MLLISNWSNIYTGKDLVIKQGVFELDGWKKYIGRTITIYYEDGTSVSKKIGVLKEVSDNQIFLQIGYEIVIINISRIVRTEIKEVSDTYVK